MPRAEQRAPSWPVRAEWHSWLIQLLAASCVIGKAKGNDPSLCVLLMSKCIPITLTSGQFGGFHRTGVWEERQEASEMAAAQVGCAVQSSWICAEIWVLKEIEESRLRRGHLFSVIWYLNYTAWYAPMCLMTLVLNKCVDTAVKLISAINRNG